MERQVSKINSKTNIYYSNVNNFYYIRRRYPNFNFIAKFNLSKTSYIDIKNILYFFSINIFEISITEKNLFTNWYMFLNMYRLEPLVTKGIIYCSLFTKKNLNTSSEQSWNEEFFELTKNIFNNEYTCYDDIFGKDLYDPNRNNNK